MKIKLVIKGDRSDAIAAAALHKIPIEIDRQIEHELKHGSWYECIAHTDYQYKREVIDWFCDANLAPFPIGTLLHYSGPTPLSNVELDAALDNDRIPY